MLGDTASAEESVAQIPASDCDDENSPYRTNGPPRATGTTADFRWAQQPRVGCVARSARQCGAKRGLGFPARSRSPALVWQNLLRRHRPRRGSLEPGLEFADGDECLTAASDELQFRPHVVLDEVDRHAEGFGDSAELALPTEERAAVALLRARCARLRSSRSCRRRRWSC